MSRIAVRIGFRRPRHRTSRLGVFCALLALSLRLASLAPPPPVISADFGDLAAFGAHALCLATPANIDQRAIPAQKAPTRPGDRGEHDHSLCCLWHASAGFIVPQTAAPARIVFVDAVSSVPAADEFHPANLTGAIRARGPPGQA